MSNLAEKKDVPEIQHKAGLGPQVIDPMPFQFKSPTIGKLAEALAKAQAEIRNAAKDKNNPFFDSSYADLASVWDACREPLSKNGLSVTQPLSFDDRGRVILTTLLLHPSGEWIGSQMPVMPVKNDPQSMGSAITYMRRFSLSSIVGVAPAEKPTEDNTDDSDDDGNAATGRPSSFQQQGPRPIVSPKPVPASQMQTPSKGEKRDEQKPNEAQLRRLYAICKEHNVSIEQVKSYLFTKWGIKSSKDLSISQYQSLCDAVQDGDITPPASEKSVVDPLQEMPEDAPSLKAMEDLEPEFQEPQEQGPAPTSNEVPWAKYRQK